MQIVKHGERLAVMDIGCTTATAAHIAASASEWTDKVTLIHTSGSHKCVQESKALQAAQPHLQSRLLDPSASPALQVYSPHSLAPEAIMHVPSEFSLV